MNAMNKKTRRLTGGFALKPKKLLGIVFCFSRGEARLSFF